MNIIKVQRSLLRPSAARSPQPAASDSDARVPGPGETVDTVEGDTQSDCAQEPGPKRLLAQVRSAPSRPVA